jgi:cytochrome b561
MLLHWAIVVLMFMQYSIAFTMPDVHRDTVPERMLNLHLSFGLLILAVVVLRFLWRLVRRPPPAPVGLPRWQHRLSQVVHWAIYLLLVVIPMVGWVNASWRGWHIRFFDLFELPHLVATRSAAGPGARSGDMHMTLAYVLLALVALHVLAALYHAVRRDGVVRRMLPWG